MDKPYFLLPFLAISMTGCSVFDEPNACGNIVTVEQPMSMNDNHTFTDPTPISPNPFNRYSFEGDIVDESPHAIEGAAKTVLMTMNSGDKMLYMIRGTAADYRRLTIQDSAFLAESRNDVRLSVNSAGTTVVSKGKDTFDFITTAQEEVGFQGKKEWQRVSCNQKFTDFTLDSIIPVNNQSYAIGFYRQDREIGFVTAPLSESSECIVHRLDETGDTRSLEKQSEYLYQTTGVAVVTMFGKRYTKKLDAQLLESLYD